MKQIQSSQNPIFKELKKLATNASTRAKLSQTILDGAHVCEMYLRNYGAPEMCVVGETSTANAEIAKIAAKCERLGVLVVQLSDAQYRVLSPVEHGGGLLFVAKIPTPEMPVNLEESAILIDRLQDPGNLGTILRTAAAAGISQVFASPGTVAAWSPKVIRAAMGAHFVLKIYENADLSNVIENAKIPVFATSSHAKTTIYDADLNRETAWLVGNEGQGVAAELSQMADETLIIPHVGEIESLNVAVATAICLFEQVRQKAVLK